MNQEYSKQLKTMLFGATFCAALWAGGVHIAHAYGKESSLIVQSEASDGRSVLAHASGLTLYVFDPDEGTTGSRCNGVCAEKWPPYILSEEERASILDFEELGEISRDSGLPQLTYEGRPVYLFYFDRVQRDIKGDGLGGVWHVVDLSE